eukprot:TRINITY_DN5483_c0_g1_i4.p2 TRINITY_DN5483_c0_g1~~TRINITY_DN5483_c0_g1_i4.p2  ORF type:complete len:243 (-),score=-90.52 TRINITY_DN5483_c0_g1_i4:483-1211(-)
MLQSRIFSAQSFSIGELLRTLQMMAASKPTSQLSQKLHFLTHLAQNLGPQSTIWAVPLLTTKLIPRCLSPESVCWYSEFDFPRQAGKPPWEFSALPPVDYDSRLTLKLFRREQDISEFDQPFTPIHSSSKTFSTVTSSVLHRVLPLLQPGHGQITRFRVYIIRLIALFILAFASAPELFTPQPCHITQLAGSSCKRHAVSHSSQREAQAFDRLQAAGFRFYFTPLTGVLFAFPSRYWFTIGH